MDFRAALGGHRAVSAGGLGRPVRPARLPARRWGGGFALIASGGLIYTLGAVVYATKWPNPWPKTFGFHEVFHLMTILAGVSMYVAVSITVYR